MAAARARTVDDEAPPAAPRSDAYTGLLIISFLAMLVGTLLLYLDYSQYPDNKPQPPPQRPAAAPAAGQPGQPQGGGAPQNPPPVGAPGGAGAPQPGQPVNPPAPPGGDQKPPGGS